MSGKYLLDTNIVIARRMMFGLLHWHWSMD